MLTRVHKHPSLLGDAQDLVGARLPDGSASHYAVLLHGPCERGDWMEDAAVLLGACREGEAHTRQRACTDQLLDLMS